MSVPINTTSPLTYTSWLKYQGNLKPDTANELYTVYLQQWYDENTLLTANNRDVIKQNYIQLLKELSFLFNKEEKDLFLTNIDYTNDEDIVFAIPYFVKKLKEICKILANKRESVKKAKIRYNLVGSGDGLEKLLYEYLLNGFTTKENNISQIPVSSLTKFFPALSSVSGDFFVELQELHDSQNYHDSDPSVNISEYVNIDDIKNDIPFKDIPEQEVLKLISSKYLSRVADTPLSRLFNQYLLEIPTLSTADLFGRENAKIQNQIMGSEKYLAETVYGLTAVRVSEIHAPDLVLDLNLKQGNNWFYWPSGDKVTNDSIYNNVYDPISINSSSFVRSSATGGDDYTNSDLIFTDKAGLVEGAWLKGPRTDYSRDKMQLYVNPGIVREFIFPYPGFKLTAQGTNFGGHTIVEQDYLLYQKLVPEKRQEILKEYYTQTLPNSASIPIYLNNTSLIYQGAVAGYFSDVADTINIRPLVNGDNPVFNDGTEQLSQEAFLYKFDQTDIPISVGITDIVWPVGAFDIAKNFPMTVTPDTCLPINLSDLNVSKTMIGAVAGTTLADSDLIYKMNTRSNDPIEAAWLGANSVNTLRLDTNSIPIYDKQALYCSSFLEGNVQGGLSTQIQSREKISFVWMDQDTYAEDVVFFRTHAKDCPYLKRSPHDYFSDQDYQNPYPIHDTNTNSWKKCQCKSVFYSPIGHAGNVLTDYNSMADYLFADPQGLGSDFALNSWVDSRGNNPLNSPQFSFYHLDGGIGDKEVGFGSGSWRTGDGSRMVLKTGKRYTYYRTSLRTDNTSKSTTPYIVINYPFKLIKGTYTDTTTQKYDLVILLDKSRSEINNIDQLKQISHKIVDGLLAIVGGDIQISIIAFNREATLLSYLSQDRTILDYQIETVDIPSNYPNYKTDLYGALVLAETVLTQTVTRTPNRSLRGICNDLNATIVEAGGFTTVNNLPRTDANKKVLIFSDGYETLNIGRAEPKASLMKNKGIEIIPIDIGPNSIYSSVMENIASPNQYFNLQQYLIDSDGELNTFIQYILSKFVGGVSVVPRWYKAVRGTDGNWIPLLQLSDMILRPGDYLTYVHRSASTYAGPNNTSFATPAISFTINVKLDGWNYDTYSFSKTFRGSKYGAKPYWGTSYLAPTENPDDKFFKGHITFGGQVRFVNEYVPVHNPVPSTISLTNGSFVQYFRRGNTGLLWTQPLNFSIQNNTYEWKKMVFYKDVSNLEDLFRTGNNKLDLVAYGSDETSDITLEGYNYFFPARYNYFARNDINYKEDLYLSNKCLNTFVQFNTAVVIEPLQPYSNLDNVHYPTIANISFPSLATTDKETGEYLVPEKLGVSYYRGKGYTIEVSGDTLSFVDSISAERLFLDTNKYGPRNRGLTKKDQISPVVIKNIDNRWMMESYSSSSAAGTIVDTLNNQKFTPYQSKYEITKQNNLGLSRQTDEFQFWNPKVFGEWISSINYPKTFRGEPLKSSVDARKVNLLVNKGILTEWKGDIFGNDYGLYKSDKAPTSIPNIQSINIVGVSSYSVPIDLGYGFIGNNVIRTGVNPESINSTNAPIVKTFTGNSSWYSISSYPPVRN